MKRFDLNQYCAVMAYATESTEGVTWDDIGTAVGCRFDDGQDAVNAAGLLLWLGYVKAVSHPDASEGKKCLMPDRVVGTSDGLATLRKLQGVLQMIDGRGGSVRRIELPENQSVLAIGWDLSETIRHLTAMGLVTVQLVADGDECPDDVLSVSRV